MSDWTYEQGEQLGCVDCAGGEPHVCPYRYADEMPEPRRTGILRHLVAVMEPIP